jgi:hypothetical protein
VGRKGTLLGSVPDEQKAAQRKVISSVIIIAVSAGLLVYWFRYTCLLILRARTTKDYATGLAVANELKFPEVQGRLFQGGIADLPELERCLARDYRLITYLLAHAASFAEGGTTLERRILMLDFQLMRTLYAVTRRIAAPQARAALREMTSIVVYLADVAGERVHAVSRA